VKRKIFPVNYLKQIELMTIERADSISMPEFITIAQNLPFLVYPAVRLQDELREKIQGNTFWDTISKKLADYQSKSRREEQILLFEEEAERKK
jgi:hypothetical protein